MHCNHLDEPTRHCWHCLWWDGATPSGNHGLCSRPRASRVTALPERGCAFYSREPGADDVPEWVPVTITEMPTVWAPSSGPSLGGTVEWAP